MSEPGRYLLLMPVYDDWASVRALLPMLDAELSAAGIAVEVLCVDDCSTQPAPETLHDGSLRAIACVRVLRLVRNLGHQRALAVGLCLLATEPPRRGVIVMDADGEDLPADVPRLLARYEAEGRTQPVFAQRLRRSEGLAFAGFYHLYRLLHRALTGIRVEMGNFSVVPHALLRRLAVSSELWNHYAAAVVHSGVRFALVPTARGRRLDGRSRMSFVSLVGHGLSAMSVFADRMGVRLLVATGVLFVLLLLGIAATVGIRLLTDLAIPGWATTATGVLLVLLAQAGMLALGFSFMVQRGRAAPAFIPARDYELFVDSVTTAGGAG